MNQDIKMKLAAAIEDFHMPAYNEIPNVGLYLDQVTKFVAEYLMPLQGITITSSMISNYVKKKMIANPVKKMYDRDQIAEILFIAVAKSVLALEDIQTLLQLQRQLCETREAYSQFCRELESMLRQVFAEVSEPEDQPVSAADPAEVTPLAGDKLLLLRRLIVTVSNKIYMETYFALRKNDGAYEDQ